MGAPSNDPGDPAAGDFTESVEFTLDGFDEFAGLTPLRSTDSTSSPDLTTLTTL